jgi:hypothetical protein
LKHTEQSVESYTGASLQSLLNNRNTRLVFKLTLFFGYNAQKNSISKTIEITETQFGALGKIVIDKNKQIISNNNSILSDDELFGEQDVVTGSLRLRNNPTKTNTKTNILITNTNTNSEVSINKLDSPKIALTLNDNSEYEISNDVFAKLVALYPSCKVLQELRKMEGWLFANKNKRKTRRGVLRFVNNWLSREQDKGALKEEDKTQSYGDMNKSVRAKMNNPNSTPLTTEQIKLIRQQEYDNQQGRLLDVHRAN